jgi:hypothetical protein
VMWIIKIKLKMQCTDPLPFPPTPPLMSFFLTTLPYLEKEQCMTLTIIPWEGAVHDSYYHTLRRSVHDSYYHTLRRSSAWLLLSYLEKEQCMTLTIIPWEGAVHDSSYHFFWRSSGKLLLPCLKKEQCISLTTMP